MLANAVSVGLFCGTLVLVYLRIVAPRYDYMGYVARPLAFWEYLLMLLFAVLPVGLLPRNWRHPTALASWMLYLVTYVPTCIIPFFAFSRESQLWWRTPAVTGLGLAVFLVATRIRIPLPEGPIAFTRRQLYWSLIILGFTGTGILLHSTGWSMNIDFSTHYDRRFAARDATAAAPLLGFLSAWLGGFFTPALAAIAIHRRSAGALALGLLSGLATFAFDGSKGWILLATLAAAATFYFDRKPRWTVNWLIGGLSLCILASLLEPHLSSSMHYSDLVARRIFIVPGFLGGCYVDFFSGNPHLFYSDVSGFSKLVPNPYGTSAAYAVGEIYLNTPGLNANAGIWPNGFAEAHLPGTMLYAAIAGIIIRFFGEAWTRWGHPLAPAGAAVAALVWTETALPTSLLSSGILFWILLVFSAHQARPPRGAARFCTGSAKSLTSTCETA